MKKIVALLLALTLVLGLAACAGDNGEDVNVEFGSGETDASAETDTAATDADASAETDAEADAETDAAGTLTLVYDHHKNDLARKLMRMQHDDHDLIITTLHVHLDHHNCLEVLVLKGDAVRVRALADRLISCKGVKHGTFSGTTTGQDLA